MENRIKHHGRNGLLTKPITAGRSRGSVRRESIAADLKLESHTNSFFKQSQEIIRERPLAVVITGLVVGVTVGWLFKR